MTQVRKIASRITLAISVCIALVAVLIVGIAGGLLISTMLKEFLHDDVISQILAIGLGGIF